MQPRTNPQPAIEPTHVNSKNIGGILGLVVSVLVLVAAPARGQSWVATGSMSVGRGWHTATLLESGEILVAGGVAQATGATPTAERYDPATGTWVLTGSMSIGRESHNAILLMDGRVLVSGGSTPEGPTPTAEVYDPITGAWTLIGSMTFARFDHSATRLTDGRVLVAAGSTPEGPTLTAELYDPATGTWMQTGSMNNARGRHTATLLTDGKVLVAGAGGDGRAAELYDPTTGVWTVTGSMNYARGGHRATLLTDGTVLVVGGTSSSFSCLDPPFCFVPTPTATAEVYDPATGAWRLTGAMIDARIDHTATLLANGRLLIAGGALGCSLSYPNLPQLNSAEEYDPMTGTWVARTLMQTGRYNHTATLLNDSRVLIAGGIPETITTVTIEDDGSIFMKCDLGPPTGGAEVYDLATSPADAEPPDTSIVSVVDGNGASVPNGGTTLSNAITLTLTATDNIAVAGFECRLDGGDVAPCTSPVTRSGLAVGVHSFEVQSVDTSGNRDGSPAAHAWSVDALPDTIVTSAVDGRDKAIPNGGTTRSATITFSFAGSDNAGVAGFECSLDETAFAACASPKTYGGIARGTHTFRVRAVDSNGFRDQSPAALTWRRR